MKQNKKIMAGLLAVLLTVSVGTVAFASEKMDTSPSFKSKSSSQTKTDKAAASYTVKKNTSYKLPAKMTTAGNTYASSDKAILTVNETTGNFTLLTSGSAYIIVKNGNTTKNIKISASAESSESASSSAAQTSSSSESSSAPKSSSSTASSPSKSTSKSVNGKVKTWYMSNNMFFLDIETSKGDIVKIYLDKNSTCPNDIITKLDQTSTFALKAQVDTSNTVDSYAHITSVVYA